MLLSKIQALQSQIEEELERARSVKDVELLKVKYLGRKGPIQELMVHLKDLSASEKPQAGKQINDFKEAVVAQCAQLLERFVVEEERNQLATEAIDVTLPGRRRSMARAHLIHQVLDEMLTICQQLGFSVMLAPDIESEYYNFESLNFAPDHPARDMQDTFYVGPDTVLRTHTTNFQVRAMQSHRPPMRLVCPGKVYRNEEVTLRSHVLFHQLDALYIDKGVTFGDLLSTMETFLQRLFGEHLKVRFRPSYFPFVEPGVEVDLQCMLCKGKGCAMCKHSGWLEIAGAGMVHPEVLKNGGIDPDIYSGFAWGMGLERMAMTKYRIKDIRLFTENDLRFLQQFP